MRIEQERVVFDLAEAAPMGRVGVLAVVETSKPSDAVDQSNARGVFAEKTPDEIQSDARSRAKALIGMFSVD